jgi:ribosome maturation factor RimP
MQEEDRIAVIEETILPVLRGHGLELVDIEWRGRGPRGVLRVFVDKPGGVGVDDCARCSREVGDVLDVAGVIPQAYDLEVSSPGLDRQLRSERELQWGVGKQVRCWLAGGRELRGRLADAATDHVVLETGEGPQRVARADVTKIRLEAEVPWPRQG